MKFAVLVVCAVANSITLLCSLWCAIRGCLSGYQIYQSSSVNRANSLRRVSNHARTPIALLKFILSKLGLTLSDLANIFAVTCLISVVFGQIGLLSAYITALSIWPKNPIVKQTILFRVIIAWTVFWIMNSFVFSFVTLFERLRSAFERTTHRIPDSWVWFLLSMVILGGLFFLSVLVLSIRTNLPNILLIVIAVSYLFGCSFLLHAFVSRVMSVANGMKESLSDDIGNKLIQAGVKMAVCVGVSLLSSLLDFSVLSWQGNQCLNHQCGFFSEFIPPMVTSMDIGLNGLCILLTMAKNVRYYRFFFGALHDRCLRYFIVPSNQHDDGSAQPNLNDQAVSVTAQ